MGGGASKGGTEGSQPGFEDEELNGVVPVPKKEDVTIPATAAPASAAVIPPIGQPAELVTTDSISNLSNHRMLNLLQHPEHCNTIVRLIRERIRLVVYSHNLIHSSSLDASFALQHISPSLQPNLLYISWGFVTVLFLTLSYIFNIDSATSDNEKEKWTTSLDFLLFWLDVYDFSRFPPSKFRNQRAHLIFGENSRVLVRKPML